MDVPSGMGILRTTTTLFAPDRSRRLSLMLVVDTGSLFTWAPAGVAEALGIEAVGVLRVRAIDERLVERRIADAMMECEGVSGYARIVFGEAEDASVLGLTAMETLGLEVDPRSQTLRKTDATLALANS